MVKGIATRLGIRNPPRHSLGGIVTASPFLFVEDIAQRYGCSTRTVHERTRLLEIPHRRLPGSRRCLFLEVDLEAWEDGAPLEVVELPRNGRIVKPANGSRR